MRTIPSLRDSLLAVPALTLLPTFAIGMQPAVPLTASPFYLQESGAGTSLGKPNVPSKVMASHCITMVSPGFAPTSGEFPKMATVIVHAVIWRSGNVTPIRAVSGPPVLQDEAMNTVRLWRYKPFVRDGEPIDVTTDIQVDFDPAKPGGIVTHPSH